jgi:hypothetical protein
VYCYLKDCLTKGESLNPDHDLENDSFVISSMKCINKFYTLGMKDDEIFTVPLTYMADDHVVEALAEIMDVFKDDFPKHLMKSIHLKMIEEYLRSEEA